MLFIRENKAAVVAAMAKRNLKAEVLIDEVLTLDEERRGLQVQLDNALAESNKLSKEIGQLYKSGSTDKANEMKARTLELKEITKELTEQLNTKTQALTESLYKLPNTPHSSVPAGNSDTDNEIVFTEGDIPKLGADALPHWELAKKYDIIDFELGVKITGAGFPVYKGKGAKLQRALITYFLDKNTDAGYQEFQVPHMVNEASGYGTGQLPDKEGQMYYVSADDLYLIPTAEVPVTNFLETPY